MSRSKRKNLGFVRDFESEKRDDDLQLLTTIEKQVQGVLSEVQYITETIETHKKVAPIEDIEAKIKESYKKIKKLMNPENADPNMALEADANANHRTSSGINVEQNPLIKEMGGMPLENISPEWRDKIEGKILDKAELENLVNKKLKNRAKLANKLKAKNQPKMRAGQQITPKFTKIQMKELPKYILKEEPKPMPAPAQKPTTVPRPPGYG